MIDGTIKNFDARKGYGFIQPSDGSRAVFFHSILAEQAGITSLVVGQKLQFEMQHDIKGRSSASSLKLM